MIILMRKRFAFMAVALLMSSTAWAAEKMAYPPAHRDAIAEQHFGITITDPSGTASTSNAAYRSPLRFEGYSATR